MAIVGRAIRQAATHERIGAEPCPECGHRRDQHREVAPETWQLVDGLLVSVPNPGYEAFVFHCGADGCGCRLDRRG